MLGAVKPPFLLQSVYRHGGGLTVEVCVFWGQEGGGGSGGQRQGVRLV